MVLMVSGRGQAQGLSVNQLVLMLPALAELAAVRLLG
jgi:hypothetical protein